MMGFGKVWITYRCAEDVEDPRLWRRGSLFQPESEVWGERSWVGTTVATLGLI